MLICSCGVGEEMGDGFDIGALTPCLRRDSSCLLDGFEPLLQLLLWLEAGGKGVAPTAECDPPVGDRTGRIADESGVEGINCVRELEGVQQGYGAIELRLSWAVAGGGEVHAAESLGGDVVVSLGEAGRRQQEGSCGEQGEAKSHYESLSTKGDDGHCTGRNEAQSPDDHSWMVTDDLLSMPCPTYTGLVLIRVVSVRDTIGF